MASGSTIHNIAEAPLITGPRRARSKVNWPREDRAVPELAIVLVAAEVVRPTVPEVETIVPVVAELEANRPGAGGGGERIGGRNVSGGGGSDRGGAFGGGGGGMNRSSAMASHNRGSHSMGAARGGGGGGGHRGGGGRRR